MLRRGPSTHVATALVNELQSRVGTEAVELTQIGAQHPKSHFSHFKHRFVPSLGRLVPRWGEGLH
jgi:hypothetical protein